MRIVTLFIVLFAMACKQKPEAIYLKLSGPAMGTRYNITYRSDDQLNVAAEIDSILEDFNHSLSTYIPQSRISAFNDSENGIAIGIDQDSYFLPVLLLSDSLFKVTNGSFDPTIMPLVRYYGFAGERSFIEDESTFAKAKNAVGFQQISWKVVRDSLFISKPHAEVELNFNSIAKGYGVDILAQKLESWGITDYLVEIGGEVKTGGKSPRGKRWKLGVNTPDPDASISDIIMPVFIENEGMASSGNYRDFYDQDGKRYVHIIDPKTGESRPSDIASATIIAENCGIADAIATAAIVMGKEKALRLINRLDGVEALFIFPEKEGFENITSHNFKKYMHE